jgi:hypothetical protein
MLALGTASGRQAPPEFVGATEVARILGCARSVVSKVAKNARIHIKALPGMPIRYRLEDVRRVAEEALSVAGK